MFTQSCPDTTRSAREYAGVRPQANIPSPSNQPCTTNPPVDSITCSRYLIPIPQVFKSLQYFYLIRPTPGTFGASKNTHHHHSTTNRWVEGKEFRLCCLSYYRDYHSSLLEILSKVSVCVIISPLFLVDEISSLVGLSIKIQGGPCAYLDGNIYM